MSAQSRHLVVNGATTTATKTSTRRGRNVVEEQGGRTGKRSVAVAELAVGLARYVKASTWFDLGPFSEDRDNGPAIAIPGQSGSRTSDKAPLFEFGES